MNTNRDRREALEWAETSEDSTTLALTHALLYVGDMLADLGLVVANHAASTPPPSPKLQALLARSTPFAAPAESAQESPAEGGQLVTYRKFSAKLDPAEWEKLPNGRWKSPGSGKTFAPYSRQVIGVVMARQKLGLPV